jgi:hypothetical protein
MNGYTSRSGLTIAGGPACLHPPRSYVELPGKIPRNSGCPNNRAAKSPTIFESDRPRRQHGEPVRWEMSTQARQSNSR